jgi:hypothetical protein
MSERVECNCEQCARLCLGNPGWFLPGEAEKAAEVLGMPFETFLQELCIIEYWTGSPDIYVLAPRRAKQQHFAVAQWADAFTTGSPCRVLGSEGCRLSVDHRPMECAATSGCSKTGGKTGGAPTRETIARLWNTPDLQEQLEQWRYSSC